MYRQEAGGVLWKRERASSSPRSLRQDIHHMWKAYTKTQVFALVWVTSWFVGSQIPWLRLRHSWQSWLDLDCGAWFSHMSLLSREICRSKHCDSDTFSPQTLLTRINSQRIISEMWYRRITEMNAMHINLAMQYCSLTCTWPRPRYQNYPEIQSSFAYAYPSISELEKLRPWSKFLEKENSDHGPSLGALWVSVDQGVLRNSVRKNLVVSPRLEILG